MSLLVRPVGTGTVIFAVFMWTNPVHSAAGQSAAPYAHSRSNGGFFDDFNDGNLFDDWRVCDGDVNAWSACNGHACVDSEAKAPGVDNLLCRGDSSLRVIAVEALAHFPDSGVQLGLTVNRRKPGEKGVFVDQVGGNTRVQVTQVGGQSTGCLFSPWSFPHTARIRVEAIEGRWRATVDGEVCEVPLSSAPMGEVGLIRDESSPDPNAWFDDVAVSAEGSSCHATRTLPAGYSPSRPFDVSILVRPPTGSLSHALEESPPPGWPVSNISHGGTFDGIARRVKWGPYLDGSNRNLSYRVRPPSTASGPHSFSGLISVDGTSRTICGDPSVEEQVELLHPADQDEDFRMELDEVTSYSAAWRRGDTWPREPNPIPLSYVTNAGFLWKSGENYHHEPSTSPPWSPGPGGSNLLAPPDWQLSSRAGGGAAASFGASGYTAGVGLTVTIDVTPELGTFAYAVEDQPPSGWMVSNIGEGGAFDSVHQKVKWGPYFDDASRSLSYIATPPPSATGTQTFSGQASFDGVTVTTTGDRQISPARNQPAGGCDSLYADLMQELEQCLEGALTSGSRTPCFINQLNRVFVARWYADAVRSRLAAAGCSQR